MSTLGASNNHEDNIVNENSVKKDDVNSTLNNYNALLSKYIDAIKPINNRLTDLLQANADIGLITGDLNKTVNYLKNFAATKKENLNPQLAVITTTSTTTLKSTSKSEDLVSNGSSSAHGDTETNLKNTKSQYAYVCNLLKGSKLVVLNKFYSRNYANKTFTGENEETEILNLASKFDISIKLVRLFIKCKKTLQ